MKGLIIKDLRLLMRQKYILLLIVLYMFFFINNGLEFTLGFLVMIASMLGTNTITCDMMDNGMAYLMTMPASRKMYVVEKYMLALLPGILAVVISIVIQFTVAFIQKQPAEIAVILVSSVAVFFAISLMTAIYLPVQLKYEAGKARIVIVMIIVAFSGCSYVLLEQADKLQGILELFQDMNKAVLCAGAVVVWVAWMAASVLCSMRIMEKKEF